MSAARRSVLGGLVLGAALLLGAGGSSPTLVINQSSSWPINGPDGTGYFDRVVREAADRVGLQVEFQALPAQRALLNAQSGLDDGDGPRIGEMAAMFPGLVQVPEPIVRYDFVAFTVDAPFATDSWDALDGRDVAIIRGWKILEKNIDAPSSLVLVRSPPDLFTVLELERANVAVVERLMGRALAQQAGVEVHELDPPLASRPMYLYLNQAHQAHVEPLAQALRELRDEGRFEAIALDVLGPDDAPWVMP